MKRFYFRRAGDCFCFWALVLFPVYFLAAYYALS